jgi:methylthioribose-1-phosphate isomerase
MKTKAKTTSPAAKGRGKPAPARVAPRAQRGAGRPAPATPAAGRTGRAAAAVAGPADGVLRGVEWRGGLDDGALILLDQTQLPRAVAYRAITGLEELRAAIIDLVVRGAPAIGIAAAYGVVLHLYAAARRAPAGTLTHRLDAPLAHAFERLASSRPTAVNLRWALTRMRDCFVRHRGHLTAKEMCARLLMEAKRIHREDAELCGRIADFGAQLLPEDGGVLTHCNTGALATGGVGTALGCIVHAVRAGKRITVFADETRPLLQGARLTALELMRAQVPVTLITDSMAGHFMSRGKIAAVIVGADRITANGDVANKIGTYALAVLARYHGIPFYVAAPYSTFDLSLQTGMEIPIEERNADEVRRPLGAQFAPDLVPVANPAFDVTPAALVSALITERGVILQPDAERVAALMDGANERAGESAV